jgi:lipid-binding SYLF domain-containing protein
MKKFLLAVLCLTVALPAFAQSKVDKRLSDSTAVLNTLLTKPDGINKSLLNKAECVLVYPAVRKVAVGIGGTYGRGVLVCRSGKEMNGTWGSPIMYTLDTGSLGVQLGSTSTDYVMLVMTQRGADKILSGKLKLGADASAAAGPNAAQASGFNDPSIDILTYSEAKGLFAGASLGSASMGADDDANKELYGKAIDAMEIVRGNATVPAAAKPLVELLDKTSPKQM